VGGAGTAACQSASGCVGRLPRFAGVISQGSRYAGSWADDVGGIGAPAGLLVVERFAAHFYAGDPGPACIFSAASTASSVSPSSLF